jgi:transcriptional regulator with XRE-family HTH domain
MGIENPGVKAGVNRPAFFGKNFYQTLLRAEPKGLEMANRQKVKARYIDQILKKARLPRNQIASISGLTNTYIRDLEQGKIVNVPRKKLIAFALAVNLGLEECDDLLQVFDRASLSKEDVAYYTDAFDRMKLTSAVYPIRDYFAYELACCSIESHPGRQIIFNDRPTNSLKEPGHRSHSDSYLAKIHPIYMDLVEAIGEKRSKTLEKTVSAHRVEHITCKQCLEDYIKRCMDPTERRWRTLHVRNMLKMVQTRPLFQLYLAKDCSNLLFTIKYPPSSKKEGRMLSYCAVNTHDPAVKRSRRLSGFATSSKVLIQNFELEAEDVKSYVHEKYLDRSALEAYLEELIQSA